MTQKRWVKWLVSMGVILAAAVVLASAGGAGSASAAGLRETAAGADKFNFISIPLDASSAISPFKASGLAAYHGSSVRQVLSWDATNQRMLSYAPGVSPLFADFSLAVGGAYFLVLDSSSTSTFSIVGSVPDPGTVSFTLAKGASTVACKFNAISIPLDSTGISTAAELASDMGGVLQVISWDATNQQIISYAPGSSPPFANFAVHIGYPYLVCVNSAGPSSWP